MEKFEINPFDRNALTDFRLLAAREDELRRVRFALRKSSNHRNRFQNVLITGNRGVGKTSFLNLIESECPSNGIIPVRINLTSEGNSENLSEFFWCLFHEAFLKLLEYGVFGGVKGDIHNSVQYILHSDGKDDAANWVFDSPIYRRNYLKNESSASFDFGIIIKDFKLLREGLVKAELDFMKNPQNAKIVFLVDEAQNLYPKTEILEVLRQIIQDDTLGFGFVFAGDDTYVSSNWEGVFGGSQRNFELIKLKYFQFVEDVEDYFTRSLVSVKWTYEDVQEKLFYRFKVACRNIFELTSGRPDWINLIARKMFDRCMIGESHLMRFDRQAQKDIRAVLKEGGQLDSRKLDFIESLDRKEGLWLASIFNSELFALKQVYFFTKFRLTGDNAMSVEEFSDFCQLLVRQEIIHPINEEQATSIGFKLPEKNKDIMDQIVIALGRSSDTMKQWLQINSEGKYSFSRISPRVAFFHHINYRLRSNDRGNSHLFYSLVESEKVYTLRDLIKEINDGTYNVEDVRYEELDGIYKMCKKMAVSSTREALIGILHRDKAEHSLIWNIYNYDDNDKVQSFSGGQATISRFEKNVESYYSKDHPFTFKLELVAIDKPDLAKFQRKIIGLEDKRKYGIIIKDKMNDLLEYYVKDDDKEKSYETAEFMYNLFQEGYDFNIYQLNNTAYVYYSQDKLEEAQSMWDEAIRLIDSDSIEMDEREVALLVFYNAGILEFKRNRISQALSKFEQVIDYSDRWENIRGSAQVLFLLNAVDGDVVIEEKLEQDTEKGGFDLVEKAGENIKLCGPLL